MWFTANASQTAGVGAFRDSDVVEGEESRDACGKALVVGTKLRTASACLMAVRPAKLAAASWPPKSDPAQAVGLAACDRPATGPKRWARCSLSCEDSLIQGARLKTGLHIR